MLNDDLSRISRQGTAAWRLLKSCKSWRYWVAVGEAMVAGRNWAMNQAGTNAPIGKGYNLCFGEWLVQYKLDDMDKGDRNRLFTVMENLPMIEEWRQTLTLNQRLALNHPNSVLRKWRKAVEPEDPGAVRKPTVTDQLVSAIEAGDAKDREIEQLKARVVELEEELASAHAFIDQLPLEQYREAQAQLKRSEQ